jgi:hypothetical protein
MKRTQKNNILIADNQRQRFCLACGTTQNMARRKYCSPGCRQQLHAALNRRTGLLKALNIRYATFYFTDFTIIMDFLRRNQEQILSYILPRSLGNKPVDDFRTLSELLGNVWWTENRRTKKRYLANRHVLALAQPKDAVKASMIPMEVNKPAVRGAAVISLSLDGVSLEREALQAHIKSAFRRQAKKHHPDLGGDPATYRKIHEAYEKLIDWALHPSFTRRNGFPDKWFYDGAINRWLHPMIIR